jgi:hypothetical protein
MKQTFSIFCMIVISVLVACRNPFAPALADEDASHSRLITQQTTPVEVLQNFQYAYAFRDSLIYSEVLDSTFAFRSINYNEYPPKPIEWARATELRTTGGMFRYFRTLDVVWNTISVADTISKPDITDLTRGYVVEHYITFTLTLDGGRAIPPLIGEVVFQFTQRGDRYFISFWEDLKI